MTYSTILDALADPTRRTLFERIRQRPRSVGELAGGLPVTQPAVSQHLRVLRQAGLVAVTHEGSRRIYRVDLAGLEPLRAYVESFWRDVLGAFGSSVTHLEPAKRNKR